MDFEYKFGFGNARDYNKWLENNISTRNIHTPDIKHVINDTNFVDSVSKARKSLGLEDYFPESQNEKNIEDWVITKLAKVNHELQLEEWHKYKRSFSKIVLEVIRETNLQPGWYEFIAAYLALGTPPKTIKPRQEIRISVQEISKDGNSITIKLDKGLSSGDYKLAWKVLKRFLQKPRTLLPYAELLKDKIFLDSQSGMTASEIAKKYFPEEYSDDAPTARDKVKKVISRYKLNR